MKNTKIKKEGCSGVSELSSETERSMMNVQAVINTLKWPDDVVMALVYCGYFHSDIEGGELMIDANQVLVLEAEIEQAEDEVGRRVISDNFTEARPDAYNYNNPPIL